MPHPLQIDPCYVCQERAKQSAGASYSYISHPTWTLLEPHLAFAIYELKAIPIPPQL